MRTRRRSDFSGSGPSHLRQVLTHPSQHRATFQLPEITERVLPLIAVFVTERVWSALRSWSSSHGRIPPDGRTEV